MIETSIKKGLAAPALPFYSSGIMARPLCRQHSNERNEYMLTPALYTFHDGFINQKDFLHDDRFNLPQEAAANHPFFAVYIWDEQDPWSPGGASRWWLHKSLNALKHSLQERGVQLIFKRGNSKALIQETKACGIYWNRCYEPYAINRDK